MDKKQLQIVWQFFKQKIKGTVFENHVFLVGGCVRDYLLDRTINDINVAVDLQNGGLDFANWIENRQYSLKEECRDIPNEFARTCNMQRTSNSYKNYYCE